MDSAILDLFSSQDPSSQIGDSGGTPSIGGIKSDMINFYNIASGKAKAADWGGGIGGGIGAILGGPEGAQFGADIGRTVLPIANQVLGPVVKGVESGVKDVASGIGGVVSGIGDAISK